MKVYLCLACIIVLCFMYVTAVNVSTNFYFCTNSTTLYINDTHPSLFVIPTNNSYLYPNMSFSCKILFNSSFYNNVVYMNLGPAQQFVGDTPFSLKIWNCESGGRDLIAYNEYIFDGYTREEQICILYKSNATLEHNTWDIWSLNLNLIVINRYNTNNSPTNNPMGPTNIPMNTTNNPMNPTNTPMGTMNIPMGPTNDPNINNDLIVTKEHPLKIFKGLFPNAAVTVNAAQGKLEVYLLFEITSSDTSIDRGKFYLYDSSDLTNFVTVLDPYQNEYYPKVATNKSFTIFSICEGNLCGTDNTQIVYRIVEYHSAHCDASAGENIVYATNSERISQSMSALQSGSCIFSLIVPYMSNYYQAFFATLNIGSLNYRGDANVKVVSGYQPINDTYVLFEFNQDNALFWKDITLYGSLISFIIPPGGVLNLFEFQSQYYSQQNEHNFNESSFGIFMSPSYPDGKYYTDNMDIETTLICNLGASIFNITIFYADIPDNTNLQFYGNNNPDIFTNQTIVNPKFLTYASTTDLIITFSQKKDDGMGWNGFLIRYEAAYIEKTSSKFHIWIIYAGVGVFIVILVLLTLFFIHRMRSNKKRFEQMYDLLRYMNFPKEDIEEMQRKSDEFLIDPTNLHIYFNHQIGQGSTSSVYKGHIVGPAPLHVSTRTVETQHFSDCDVAVKLASNFSINEVENLLQEINAMKKIGSHKNVISFLGWCMYKKAPCLTFELAEQDLLTYVQSFREKVEEVSQWVFLSILWQITQGMQYIASRGLIHRDLAARNILLCDNQVAKISDFGLCCNPGQNLIYQASLPKKLPMKWLSIEALTNRIFSERSDVWSFGILSYEVYSLGKTPYENLDSTDVLEFLQTGRRLEKPDLVSEDLYNLMKSCWEEEQLNRPVFSELSEILRKMLDDATKHYEYLLV